MSKKKGKKMGLGEFLGKDFKSEGDVLPRAPSGMPREDRRGPRGGMGGGFGNGGGFGEAGASEGEWVRDRVAAGGDRGGFGDRGGDRGGFGDRGGDRGGFGDRGGDRGMEREEMFSAADEDTQWRRGPAPGADRGGFGGDRGMGTDGPAFSAADAEDEWRRGPRAGNAGMDAAPAAPSMADEDTQWRRNRIQQAPAPGRGPAPPSEADSVDQWRRSTPPAAAPAAQDAAPRADPLAEDNWRRGPPAASASANAAAGSSAGKDGKDALAEDNWRKGPAATSTSTSANAPAAAEDAAEDSRPRLKLKPKAGDAKEEPKEDSEKADKEAPKEESEKPKEVESEKPSVSGEPAEKEEQQPPQAPKSGADKWDNIFGSRNKEAEGHRMYGDQDRDREREKEFSAFNPRKPAPAPEAFSRGRGSGEASGAGQDGATPFASRGPAAGGFGGPRERPGSHAFGSSRRDRDEEGGFAQRGPQGNNAFGGAVRGPQGDFPMGRRQPDYDRERASMAFGSSGRRDRDMDQQQQGAGAFGGERGAFGGERGERGAFGGERGDRGAFGGERGERGGFGGPRGAAADMDAGRPKFGAQKTRNLAELAEISDKPGDWGDDENDVAALKKEAPKKEEKQLTEEEMQARTEAMLKTYMLMENKKDAIAAVREINNKEYMAQVVRKAVIRGSKEGLKECKIVVALIEALVKEELVTKSDVVKGLEVVCEKIKSKIDAKEDVDKDRLENTKRIAKMLQEKECFGDEELGEALVEVALPESKKKDAAEEEKDASADVKLIEKLIASGEQGEELAGKVQVADVSADFGAEFIKRALAAHPEYVEDESCKWASPAGYGALLGKLLYEEDPDSDKLKAQMNMIFAIQAAFHKAGFPRASNNQSLLEKVFMNFYNNDVVPPEAIIEWKDDLTDTDGKVTALVQTAQFVAWLEADDDDDDDEDED